MKVAIIAWGSLIWEPRNLKSIITEWENANMTIPVEFTGVAKSRKNALTLVIDFENGTEVPFFYTISKVGFYESIIELAKRENMGNNIRNIGFVDFNKNIIHTRDKRTAEIFLNFAKEKNFDYVIWTDLEPKFKIISKKEFNFKNALDYLQNLKYNAKQEAIKYIENSPIETNLKKFLIKEKFIKGEKIV
jgi:cation transport regulator ChaC